MKKYKLGIFILASAIIWGAVLISCAYTLKGTPYKDQINHIITAGMLTHLILIWGLVAASLNKKKSE